MLKALILSLTPDGERAGTLASFRGSRANDYDWLKARYFHRSGPGFPSLVSKSFALVNTWSTDLRYKAGATKYGEAEAFLRAAEEILVWADGRL